MKSALFWKLYELSKNEITVLGSTYIETISQKKNENRTSRLRVEP